MNSRAASSRDLADAAGIPRNAEGPVFREPWEAQAFALALSLHERGVFSWSEWATVLGLADPRTLARTRDAWAHACARTPHGAPIALQAEDFADDHRG
jgi:hypothetical protein